MTDRITINPEICGGAPCIRGMRVRVTDIIDMLAAGATRAEILADYPYLEDEDISAVMTYAWSAHIPAEWLLAQQIVSLLRRTWSVAMISSQDIDEVAKLISADANKKLDTLHDME